jgi:murein DD-endopeptidase MepM/ murein hydrolase activator NlpD
MSYCKVILILMLLSGCASTGPGDKYLKNISQTIEKEYGIAHGELLAKYHLSQHTKSDKCLFDKDFGVVVSDEMHSQKFLSSVQHKIHNIEKISTNANAKMNDINRRLYDINLRYALSKVDMHKLQTIISTNKSNHSVFDLLNVQTSVKNHKILDGLFHMDKIIKNIPTFLPQTHSVITSNFGYRKHPISGKRALHSGTDFAGSKHSMIYASADGSVIDIAHSKSYGTFIMINHGRNFRTRYAHLSKLYVSIGEKIFQGQLIGRQGKTGHTTNDHLHFEIIHNNIPIDPMIFIGSEYHCRNI